MKECHHERPYIYRVLEKQRTPCRPPCRGPQKKHKRSNKHASLPRYKLLKAWESELQNVILPISLTVELRRRRTLKDFKPDLSKSHISKLCNGCAGDSQEEIVASQTFSGVKDGAKKARKTTYRMSRYVKRNH